MMNLNQEEINVVRIKILRIKILRKENLKIMKIFMIIMMMTSG